MTANSPEKRLERVHSATRGIRRLEQLLAVLRGPGGCPWDIAQTHQSLAPYLLEESFEAVEAIDAGDTDMLVEELGDVLLQVVFHAQLGHERQAFDLDEIAQREVEKMVARHPHVFADIDADSAEDVARQWEARKRENRKATSIAEGVPRALPALTRAQTITARASGLGFDWTSVAEVLPKLQEELNEVLETIDKNGSPKDPDAFEDELGDLIFAAVNLARKAGLDAEAALRKAIEKFTRRFDMMDKPDGNRWDSEQHADDWDQAWRQAKRRLKSET